MDYTFNGLEYRHCIAMAKVLEYVMTRLQCNEFLKRNDLYLNSDGFLFADNDDIDFDRCVRIGKETISRAGCMGAVLTHCISFYPDGHTIRIVQGHESSFSFQDNPDFESLFFQNILVLEPMKVLYIVVFNYLHNIKCIDSFDIEMSLMRIINQIPELQSITEEPYFDDFTELYRMHRFEGDE